MKKYEEKENEDEDYVEKADEYGDDDEKEYKDKE